MDDRSNIRPSQGGFRWDGVDVLAYKEEGSAPFKAITRQVLFQRPELGCELRYFEMQPGGLFHAGAARARSRGDDIPGTRRVSGRRRSARRGCAGTSCSSRP